MHTDYKAYVAGGCFWGLEDLLRKLPGVTDTEVGYMGGTEPNPTYENHTGHAEAVEISYDPSITTFRELLLAFFRFHNPTTIDQQGNDRGSSYRSAIFYQNEIERTTAEAVIAFVDGRQVWPTEIVTTLEAFASFHPAEDYHQDYLIKNPNGYTCHQEYFASYE